MFFAGTNKFYIHCLIHWFHVCNVVDYTLPFKIQQCLLFFNSIENALLAGVCGAVISYYTTHEFDIILKITVCMATIGFNSYTNLYPNAIVDILSLITNENNRHRWGS